MYYDLFHSNNLDFSKYANCIRVFKKKTQIKAPTEEIRYV